MKKYILLLLFPTLLSFTTKGDDGDTIDFYKEVKSHDVSFLWSTATIMKTDDDEKLTRPEPIGFIGDNYQRFYIHFISVIQDQNNPYNYFVYGKSKVKNNICTFQGTISLKSAVLYKESDYKNYNEGMLEGEYIFFEDKKEPGTGVFKGKVTVAFAKDKKEALYYNALMLYADGYSNNHFEGTWQSYKTADSKKCNWGDFRMPDSGNLDSGAGEFMVTEAYYKYGWENYRTLFDNTPEGEKAREKESVKWWEE